MSWEPVGRFSVWEHVFAVVRNAHLLLVVVELKQMVAGILNPRRGSTSAHVVNCKI